MYLHSHAPDGLSRSSTARGLRPMSERATELELEDGECGGILYKGRGSPTASKDNTTPVGAILKRKERNGTIAAELLHKIA